MAEQGGEIGITLSIAWKEPKNASDSTHLEASERYYPDIYLFGTSKGASLRVLGEQSSHTFLAEMSAKKM